MVAKKLRIDRDATADLLFAIGVGFLINFLLGVALPETGPFVSGLVAGVLVKEGPFKGGLAGFLAGTLGGIASIGLWVTTNLLSPPNSLLPLAFQYVFAIMTATYAVLSLSGGVVGSVVATQRWPQVLAFLKRERLPSFPSFPASPAGIEKQED
ncbi:hypothetical protein E6H36_04815 [Candidatus Bathyarchaeota archaeon]|nr:MAG: hypothetical protein E6H36_04815 [Candidatus Bathyarchaeota archaeon]TMI31309.1 MAG: hypothetical protein E6H29_05885 [Candidatus Bathyarchaeota archaeon]